MLLALAVAALLLVVAAVWWMAARRQEEPYVFEEQVDFVGVEEKSGSDPAGPGALPDGDYEIGAAEEMPELLNRQEVAAIISRNYPPLLRDAGVTGSVMLRFRILTDGTVDPASVEAFEATHQEFVDAARGVVPQMRFRPARVGGRVVRVWVLLPVQFTLQQ